MKEIEWYCPRCDKKSTQCVAGWVKYSFVRLDAPYYVCGDCKLAFVSRKLIRQSVRAWYAEKRYRTENVSFQTACKEFWNYIDKNVISDLKHFGYRIVRFKQK